MRHWKEAAAAAAVVVVVEEEEEEEEGVPWNPRSSGAEMRRLPFFQ